jgi:UPF0755 protein
MRKHNQSRPKKSPFRIVFLFAAFMLVALLYIFFPPFFRSGADVTVPVYSHTTARGVANRLSEMKVVTTRLPFLVLCKTLGADRRIKAGLYRLSPRMSLWGVTMALVSGKSDLLTLRIPEGYSAAQIAEELEKLKVMPAEAFLATVRDPAVVRSLGLAGSQLEGYLYPETYRLPLDTDAQDLVTLMTDQFKEEAGDDFAERAKRQGLTPYQAVIIASMVEKEAQRDFERPMVAGVILNRLRQRMPLCINATLNYVLQDRRRWLTYKQLDTDSPYNTYKRRGLPPTPIGNPGKRCLEAVLEAATVPYLYYVGLADGSHLFAETLEQHDANVKRAKRERWQLRMQKR